MNGHCDVAGCREPDEITYGFPGMAQADICLKHHRAYGDGEEIRLRTGKVLRIKVTRSAEVPAPVPVMPVSPVAVIVRSHDFDQKWGVWLGRKEEG